MKSLSTVRYVLATFLAAAALTMAVMPSKAFAQTTATVAAPAETAVNVTTTVTTVAQDSQEVDVSKLPDGSLNLEQIKELFTGKKLTGVATFSGNKNSDVYTFGGDKTMKAKTMRGNIEWFSGEGRWLPRNISGTESMCWDVKGTWQSFSCFQVYVDGGKIKLGTWFVQK